MVLAAMMSALLAAHATAQSDERGLDVRARVFDSVFPLDVPASYGMKMVLRFSDSASQLVVLQGPLRKAELIRYRITNMTGAELAQLIDKLFAENPKMTERDIVPKLKVDVDRRAIDYDVVERAVVELQKIRISPALGSPQGRIGVDDVTQYEFWLTLGSDSVHYTILSPGDGKYPQDALAEWMVKFRATVANQGGARAR